MIQRIQSFYLILAVCALALCFMFPVAKLTLVSNNQAMAHAELELIAKDVPADMLTQIESGLDVAMSQKGIFHVWPITILAGLAGVIALVAIFLYKNRMRQVRVVACGFLLNVIYIGLVFLWATDGFGKVLAGLIPCESVSVAYGVGTWASVASLVLLFLAQRAIKRDEAKVRAADRLR